MSTGIHGIKPMHVMQMLASNWTNKKLDFPTILILERQVSACYPSCKQSLRRPLVPGKGRRRGLFRQWAQHAANPKRMKLTSKCMLVSFSGAFGVCIYIAARWCNIYFSMCMPKSAGSSQWLQAEFRHGACIQTRLGTGSAAGCHWSEWAEVYSRVGYLGHIKRHLKAISSFW